MYEAHEAELLSACRVLFGPDVEVTMDFLWYLQPEGAKLAYRKRARESHPDAHPWARCEQRKHLQEEFYHLSNAYQTLQSYLASRKKAQPGRSADQPNPVQRSNPRTQCTQQQLRELYYQGPVPWIELKLGRYLYFRGLVSYQAVLQALNWQRMQRPTIGALARRWGWLSDTAVHRILQTEQVSGRFGQRARRLGLLSHEQVQTLLTAQQRAQKRIGEFFVVQGLLQEMQLAILDCEHLLHNRAVATSCRPPYDA